MLLILILLFSGIAIGRLIHQKTRIIGLFDRLTVYAIWILLFLLGLSIGKNPDIMGNLSSLGLSAFTITLFALLGSILLSVITYRLFFRNHES
jgi:hypothetical protein